MAQIAHRAVLNAKIAPTTHQRQKNPADAPDRRRVARVGHPGPDARRIGHPGADARRIGRGGADVGRIGRGVADAP